ncbi:hypothetical protein IAU60_003128 [Kwoniella sp. DSM 27419]
MSGLPSHDFYQNDTTLTLGIYVKGYGAESVKEEVKVDIGDRSIAVSLPEVAAGPARQFTFEPLYDKVDVGASSFRVLNTKIEVRLVKAQPATWPSLLASSGATSSVTSKVETPAQLHGSSSAAPSTSSVSGPSGSVPAVAATSQPQASSSKLAPAPTPTPAPVPRARKNWDKMIDEELVDKEDDKDPNTGGDAALQSFFSQIYANADEDTKRAMIKSFTESGGTSLSTDWNSIGKETTPIRPPDGMEARKYS